MQWLSTVLQSMARPLKWWVVVASWEQGLRVRFGKRTALLNPGVHFRIPFIDRIYVQSTRLRVVLTSDQSISTKDGQVVTLSIAVRYQIRNIVDVYQSVASPEGILLFDALTLAAGYVSTRALTEISPKSLEEEINSGMHQPDYGLEAVCASVIGFCSAKCYRLITGNTWTHPGQNLDDSGTSGEVI